MIDETMNRLLEIRAERVDILRQTINADDPNAINHMIADAINLLEHVYLILNLPQEGFIPTTPKIEHGTQDGQSK